MGTDMPLCTVAVKGTPEAPPGPTDAASGAPLRNTEFPSFFSEFRIPTSPPPPPNAMGTCRAGGSVGYILGGGVQGRKLLQEGAVLDQDLRVGSIFPNQTHILNLCERLGKYILILSRTPPPPRVPWHRFERRIAQVCTVKICARGDPISFPALPAQGAG